MSKCYSCDGLGYVGSGGDLVGCRPCANCKGSGEEHPITLGSSDLVMQAHDSRQNLKGWARGDYLNKCRICSKIYVGSKDSVSCAPCAYEDEK